MTLLNSLFIRCRCGHSRGNHLLYRFSCITTLGYPHHEEEYMVCKCKKFVPTNKKIRQALDRIDQIKNRYD